MPVTKEAVIERLKSISAPGLSGDIVSLGLVSDVFIADGKVFFSITVPADKAQELEPMREAAERAVKEMPDVAGAVVALTAEKKAGQGSPAPRPAAPRPASAPTPGRVPDPAGHGRRFQNRAADRRAGTAGRRCPAYCLPPAAGQPPATAQRDHPGSDLERMPGSGRGREISSTDK